MYKYFIHKIDKTILIPVGFTVSCRSPWDSLHDFIWQIASSLKGHGRLKLWELKNPNGVVVSNAYTIGDIWQFPFMKKDDIHIGPCKTGKEFRGNGYYPILLLSILRESKGRNFFMIVDENNIPSLKGVAKAGFECFAMGEKDTLKRYNILRKEINE